MKSTEGRRRGVARYRRRGDWIAGVVVLVRQNPAAPIERIAEELGKNPKHLATAFRKRYGMTPLDFRTLERLRKAQALLLRGATVDEAALAVGYADASGLRRAFRRVVRCAPEDWLQHARAASEREGTPNRLTSGAEHEPLARMM